MDGVYMIIAAALSSSLLTAIINNAFTLLNKKSDKNNAIRNGVQLILYSEIKRLGKKYIDAGQVSYEDLEDLIKMHKCYHSDLGGNGYLDSLMNSVKELHIIN